MAFGIAATGAMAGGIDRSGQDISFIFEDGDRAMFSLAHISPSVSSAGYPAGAPVPPFAQGPMTQSAVSFNTFSLGYKRALNENLELSFIVDQPFGADIEYLDGLPFNSAKARAFVDSNAISGILRYKMDNGFSVHGGLRAQNLKGQVNDSSGQLDVSSDYTLGSLVGVAYEKPEIALRVALTYFSSVTHELSGGYGAPLGGGNFGPHADETGEVTMPEAFNLDFQTGVAANTLVFGSIRHVKWKGIELNTTSVAEPWVEFKEDTTTYKLGMGRKFNDNWSGAITLGYEEGKSTGTSFLAPTAGTKSIGIGGAYTEGNMKVSGGVQYIKFGDKTVQTNGMSTGGLPGLTFADNDGWVAGMKVEFMF